MDTRDVNQSASWLAKEKTCVVMTCDDVSEAEEVGRTLLELNIGVLVTYRKAEDLMANAPTGQVLVAILATRTSCAILSRTLQWLRHRWPRCSVTVVGDLGSGDYEMAARMGGASYMTRPVTTEEWLALLSHVLVGQQANGTREPGVVSNTRQLGRD